MNLELLLCNLRAGPSKERVMCAVTSQYMLSKHTNTQVPARCQEPVQPASQAGGLCECALRISERPLTCPCGHPPDSHVF